MRVVVLGPLKTGITRLRDKGGASPQSLYDLVNGYLTDQGTVRSRGAFVWENALPPGATKGLMVFKGKFMVFSSEPVESSDPAYTIEILKHPDPESTAALADIHFAAPFLGYPYVVAEWSDGLIKHYWLQTAEAWQANHVYRDGQVVLPTTPNGYAFRATRLGGAAQPWAPNVARAVNDKVEPTIRGGYEHTVIEVYGDNPRSAATEPVWSTTEGGITYEDADDLTPQGPDAGSGGDTNVPPEVRDRYGGGQGGEGFNTVIQ
jgi:hypothetical protein